jgi:hypothetical protein
LTFYDKSESNNDSVKNELDLISCEYLQFLKQAIEEDHKLLTQLNIPTQTIDEKNNWFKTLAPGLLDHKGDIKNRGQIRATTKPEIMQGLKKNGTFLTEKEKFQRISDKGFADYGFVFVAFKYYSQFQHFTLMSKKFIESKPFHDTYYMALTIDHMLMTCDIILQISKSPNVHFRNDIANIRTKINSLFSK